MMTVLKRILLTLLLLIGGLLALVYLAPETTLHWLQQMVRWRAGLERMEMNVGGINTVYLAGGQGEPLLLLHGFGGEKDSFARTAFHLTDAYRLIIPDIPGFGESGKPVEANYSVDAHIKRLHTLVNQLGHERISVGGNSMGGFLAAAYAARYPDEVESLWLLAPGGMATVPRGELATLLRQRNPHSSLAPATVEDFLFTLQYVTARPLALPRPILKVIAKRAVGNFELHETIYRQLMASPPLEARIQGLTTPTLIVWGDSDRVGNIDSAAAIEHLMPNATIKIMPGIGHLPMVENPRQAAHDYLAFRRSIE